MLFHDLSRDLLNWILNQPNVKEESLTDRLLYEVSKGTDRFIYKTFTRNEESLNGTDWEWWVLTAEPIFKAYRFLVQAKKLKADGKDKYAQMCYSNRNGMQIDLLINSAMERCAMPLYMFYSSENIPTAESFNHCKDIQKILDWCKDCKNGAFLSSACFIKDRVFNEPRRFISSAFLLSHSIKISLLDLLVNSIDNYNHRATMDDKTPYEYMTEIHELCWKHLRDSDAYLDSDVRHECKSSIGFDYEHHEIPNYLRALIRQEQGMEHWFESEFSNQFYGLSGVAVLDLRPEMYRRK